MEYCKELGIVGKGVYLWRPANLGGGDPIKACDILQAARVKTLCIKLVDGAYQYPDVGPIIQEWRRRGGRVLGWGYTYLKFNPLAEAKAAAEAINKHKVEAYLIDAEGHAAWQTIGASLYINLLVSLTKVPLALNSYWAINLHPEIKGVASKIRSRCQFDAPQVYWRGYKPVDKLFTSRAQYSNLLPVLPFALPAGDMYLENGVMPAPGQITEFLTAVSCDKSMNGVLMWSADQCETTPVLWNEFASFHWDAGEPVMEPEKPPVPSGMITPLFFGVVTATSLYVRNLPNGTAVGGLKRGDHVDVWALSQSGGRTWYALNKEETRWSAAQYISKI